MAKGKALPPFPRICCALSLSLFRCVLFLFMTRVMIKNTRERRKCCGEGRENFIFFTRFFARRIKSRRRDTEIGRQIFWSSFFCRKRETKKRQNFFQNKSFILSFIFFSSSLLLILFCGVSLPRSEDHGESFCEKSCFLKTQREKEREKCVYFFF